MIPHFRRVSELTNRDQLVAPSPTMTDVPGPTSSPAGPSSALAAALERVGDRWSLLVVEALLDRPGRFNEIADALAGIAPNILADRLRRLEREGIVRAVPYSQRPPRMEYALTAAGKDLAGALRLLADWGARRAPDAPDAPEPLRHGACGTPLETRWFCPTCGEAIGEHGAHEAPGTRLV